MVDVEFLRFIINTYLIIAYCIYILNFSNEHRFLVLSRLLNKDTHKNDNYSILIQGMNISIYFELSNDLS